MGEIRIGISGWRYAGWRGVFYPPELAQRRELGTSGCCSAGSSAYLIARVHELTLV